MGIRMRDDNDQRTATRHQWLRGGLMLAGLLLATCAQAGPKLSTDDPTAFFNTLGGILLKSELNLDLRHLQVWPTNQYTPAAHRLLQVTANLYDATTNRADAFGPLPTVFKPVFQRDGAGVFITSYVEVVGDSTPHLTKPRDLRDAAEVAALEPNDNVYGVPWVIGARKGLPNFNEFAFQSVFQITRKLQITRDRLGADPSTFQTNQMYLLSISNVLGAEVWNSSTRSDYTRPVEVIVANDMNLSLTNSDGLRLKWPLGGTAFFVSGYTNLSAWPAGAFVVPLLTNINFPIPSMYRQTTHSLTNRLELPFEIGQGFPFPQWGAAVTNRLQFIMRDRATGRILDYVHMIGLDNMRDLNAEMLRFMDGSPGWGSLWDTNRQGGSSNIFAPTRGIVYQVWIALGEFNANKVDWTSYGLPIPSKLEAIDNFRRFFDFAPIYNQESPDNTNLVQEVPFTPSLRLSRYSSWQANDPLVHYTLADLLFLPLTNTLRQESVKPNVLVQTIENIGRINNRYQPWGGSSVQSQDPSKYNLALKDPLVSSSDDWNFPESEPLGAAMLGRVHRGTPWQTLYLKSADGYPTAPLSPTAWMNWTGNGDWRDVVHTLPVSDRRLVSLLVSLLNTNRPQDLASANQPDATGWLPILDKLTVWTNSLTDAQVQTLQYAIPPLKPWFDPLIMTADSPQAAFIAESITATRAAQPGGVFRDPADILATPALGLASPWLNLASTTQLVGGLTDEAYEMIPSQLLARLRADSVGRISSSNGLWRVQFTGFDGYPYAVEVSSDLAEWSPISTNVPTGGVFEFTEPLAPAGAPRYYRSVAVP